MAGQPELRKFVAPELVFGEGARLLAGQYARNYGLSRVLVVTDPGVENAGWSDDVVAGLTGSGIEHVLFDRVSSNPRSAEVMNGAATYQEYCCDGIVTVGGGSCIDCAKGIGIVVSNNNHILTFEGVDMVHIPMPPLISIPTTAGSAADVSQFAIISDEYRHVKIAIISKATLPDVSLSDPETTMTMPPELTSYTGMDVLCHAGEALVSNASSPFTDLFAIEAIRLVNTNLLNAINNPGDRTARRNMMLASSYAGLAFSNASLGLVHAMAHSLGGLLDLPHGECNSLLLEHVIPFNFNAARDKYIMAASALGISSHESDTDPCSSVVSRIHDLRVSAGIRGSLSELGVTRDHIPRLAKNALNDPCIITNPRIPKLHEIEELYVSSL
jgi:Alcohol dehydrogenase, class IV